MINWLRETPTRSLLAAYQAALAIKNIEVEHFQGQKISTASGNYTENVMSYWRGCLNRHLKTIKIRLAEFRLTRTIFNISHPSFLEKLQFIDQVIEKYQLQDELINSSLNSITNNRQNQQTKIEQPKNQSIFQKSGFFPRSIGRTINRIAGDFNPNTEEEFLRQYHISQHRTRTTIRFFSLLIIVPLLTHQLSKQFLVRPMIDNLSTSKDNLIFLNGEMEEHALQELKVFEERLKFYSLIQQAPSLSANIEEVKEKAREIAAEFRHKSKDAISNVFADLISLIAFAIIIVSHKREIAVVKDFMDNIVYGLSDSAKAFLIILFTDIFVGFHSAHGWEVLLEGLAEHFGLPASRNVIFLFIATFPVVLNTIFKYWIFRYLSRLSPSALATLKEMDE